MRSWLYKFEAKSQNTNETAFQLHFFKGKESTIVMAFRQCFFFKFVFDTPEVTKIVLQNFKKTPNTRWPKELNQKG